MLPETLSGKKQLVELRLIYATRYKHCKMATSFSAVALILMMEMYRDTTEIRIFGLLKLAMQEQFYGKDLLEEQDLMSVMIYWKRTQDK